MDMFMFDFVVCDCPLPGGYVSETGIQTKDGPGELAHLRITVDGRLQWEGREGVSNGLFGETKVDGVHDIPFHGDMVLYDTVRYFVARFWRDRVRFIKEATEKEVYSGRSFLDYLGTEGMGDDAAAHPAIGKAVYSTDDGTLVTADGLTVIGEWDDIKDRP